MPNWCTTSFIVKGDRKAVEAFAATAESLRHNPSVSKNDFGPFWLVNLGVALGEIDSLEQADASPDNYRGVINSEPEVPACWNIDDPSDKPFEATVLGDGSAELRFSTQSAWNMPMWLVKHLRRKGMCVSYKTTDESGNFHRCHGGEDFDWLHSVKCGEGDYLDFKAGQEQELLDAIERQTPLRFTPEQRKSTVLAEQAVCEYNKSLTDDEADERFIELELYQES